MPLKIPVSLGAGHGGHDLGALGPDGAAEKSAALLLCARVAELLAAAGGFEIFLTRQDDRFLSLRERVQLACRWGPECHLELHLGGCWGAEQGPCVLYAREQSRVFARALAESLRAPLGGGLSAVRLIRKETLLRGLPREDACGLLPALAAAGVPHVLLVECGSLEGETWRGAFAREELPPGVAEAVAGELCRRFGVAPLRRWPPARPAAFSRRTGAVKLREGVFCLRSGPGETFGPAGSVRGGVFAQGAAGPGGWLELAPGRFLSPSAVEGPAPFVPAAAVAPARLGVVRPGFFYIRERPGPGGRAVGIAEEGQEYPFLPENGFCRVPLGERAGYLTAGALTERDIM